MTRSLIRSAVLALCLGLAVAWPGAAQAQRDDVSGDTLMVDLGRGASATRAFVALPAGRGPAPAVVVIHEWWGLNVQIRRLARRIARQGYVAIVPDLYHGATATTAEQAHELSRGLDDDGAMRDIGEAVRWLSEYERTRGRAPGVLGFCMGGRLSLETGLRRGDVAGVVLFYGRPVTDPDRLRQLKVPLQAHFGDADRGIDSERVAAFEKALAAAGKDAVVHRYAGAGHAFMNETRDSYHPDASRLAWARMLAFFQKHLKGPDR